MNQYKYSFRFTEKELREFCIRAVADLYRRRPAMWITLFVLCLAELFVVPVASAALLLLFLAAVILDVVRTFRFLKKEHFLERRIMWVEDGLLKCSAAGCSEIPCGRITVMRKTGSILMLGYPQSKRRLAWYPMPLRIFESGQELDAFLDQIRNPVCPPPCPDPDAGGMPRAQTGAHPTQEEPVPGATGRFHFSFFMEQEKWIWIYREAAAVINGRTLGFPRTEMLVIGIYGTVFAAASVIWYFMTTDRTILFPAALFLLLLFIMLIRWKADPEKSIRRKLKAGDVQNDIYGHWEITFLEEGIVESLAGRNKSFLPWEQFGWVVETEYLFFLFKKNKAQFIPIPKENMESADQAARMCAFCGQKGLRYLPGKRVKYWPVRAFAVGTVILLLLLLLIGVWSGMRRDMRRIQERMDNPLHETVPAWEEEFRPEDYPDYVPLDTQVQVLSSLGFEVPPETVESARASMEEYGMRAYVEGYPYTWLLTGIGSPSYDENWEISGYPAQVFWFDFEGMDVSTDYIHVLEGMLALAKGSPLDRVEDIGEDTDKADWEQGTGKITVFLKWEGQPYSWDMKMEYDWIDGNILGVLNGLLEETDAKERFYVTGDNGQGALVFYRTKEWADRFEKATGLPLDKTVTK